MTAESNYLNTFELCEEPDVSNNQVNTYLKCGVLVNVAIIEFHQNR